jgi:hypothetical protein
MLHPPLCLPPLTADERLPLEIDRRTTDAFCIRRAPIALASARGMKRITRMILKPVVPSPSPLKNCDTSPERFITLESQPSRQ